MKLPEMTLKNHKNVYDTFRKIDPNVPFARFGHFVFGQINKPIVGFAPGVEAKHEKAFGQGYRMIMFLEHYTDKDQNDVAAMAQRTHSMKPVLGRARIAAKHTLWLPEEPKYFHGQARAITWLGSYPTFNKKNIVPKGVEPTAEQLQMLEEAGEEFCDVSAEYVERGQHLVSFSGGGRHPGKGLEMRTIQPTRRGLGQTVCRISVATPFFLQPVGLWKGDDRKAANTSFYFGEPIFDSFITPSQVTDTANETLQTAQDQAIQQYERLARYP